MSRTSDHRARRRGGFTLVELMIGMTLAFLVMGGILSAYLFLGRNFTRMMNLQKQEVRGRRVLQLFTSDVSSAIQFTTASDTQLVASVQTAGAPATVTYLYVAGTGGTGQLTRVDGAGTNLTLLTDLSAFDFNYFAEDGTATTSLPSIKSAQFSYTSAFDAAANGTRAPYTTVSAKVVLRNKLALQ